MLKEAIKLNPELIQPYLTLAGLYKSQSRTEDAIAQYKALIEKRPDLAAPQNLLATILDEKGELELAETHYKKALEIDSSFVPALNNLAYLYARQNKDLNTALDLAQRAKEKSWNSPAVLDTLGWVYYKKELYDSAITEFKGSIEKYSGNPMFHYHLGLAYNKKWDYANAVKSLNKALELDTNFDGAEEARKILAEIQ